MGRHTGWFEKWTPHMRVVMGIWLLVIACYLSFTPSSLKSLDGNLKEEVMWLSSSSTSSVQLKRSVERLSLRSISRSQALRWPSCIPGQSVYMSKHVETKQQGIGAPLISQSLSCLFPVFVRHPTPKKQKHINTNYKWIIDDHSTSKPFPPHAPVTSKPWKPRHRSSRSSRPLPLPLPLPLDLSLDLSVSEHRPRCQLQHRPGERLQSLEAKWSSSIASKFVNVPRHRVLFGHREGRRVRVHDARSKTDVFCRVLKRLSFFFVCVFSRCR